LNYLTGFGSHHETEAVAGALPSGQNSPQKVAFGLYAEQLSGSAFTAPRSENLRSWLYRLRPVAMHRPFERMDDRLVRTAPCHEKETPPNRLRWSPLPMPAAPTEAATVEISAEDVFIESPGGKVITPVVPIAPEVSAKPATLKLKMAKAAKQNCPKCGWILPESQRGSFYTECRRCGEIIKTEAA